MSKKPESTRLCDAVTFVRDPTKVDGRICQTSPLLRNEFTATQEKIVFPCKTFSERAERMFHQLIPVPSRKSVAVSSRRMPASPKACSLINFYQRAQRLPVVGKDLYAGNGLLCFWSHEPLHPWQTEQERRH
jgi:hypothetical protein